MTAVKSKDDYLMNKINNAYCEISILSDNIQLLNYGHITKLIALNSLIGNVMHWKMLDDEEID